MSLIFCEDGLDEIRPPCVAQSFINHSARLYKLFVIKDKYFVIERPSLKNFKAGSRFEMKWNYYRVIQIWQSRTKNHFNIQFNLINFFYSRFSQRPLRQSRHFQNEQFMRIERTGRRGRKATNQSRIEEEKTWSYGECVAQEIGFVLVRHRCYHWRWNWSICNHRYECISR